MFLSSSDQRHASCHLHCNQRATRKPHTLPGTKPSLEGCFPAGERDAASETNSFFADRLSSAGHPSGCVVPSSRLIDLSVSRRFFAADKKRPPSASDRSNSSYLQRVSPRRVWVRGGTSCRYSADSPGPPVGTQMQGDMEKGRQDRRRIRVA